MLDNNFSYNSFNNIGVTQIVWSFGDRSFFLTTTAGLENSTRPLVFTSALGCRASENFDTSSEN